MTDPTAQWCRCGTDGSNCLSGRRHDPTPTPLTEAGRVLFRDLPGALSDILRIEDEAATAERERIAAALPDALDEAWDADSRSVLEARLRAVLEGEGEPLKYVTNDAGIRVLR